MALSVAIVSANDSAAFDTALTTELTSDTDLADVRIIPLEEAGAITVAVIRVIP